MLFVLPMLLLSAATSSDTPTATTAIDTATTAKPERPKKICRAGAVTGTRMSNKICKTQAEWDAQQGADPNKIDALRNDRGAS